MNNKRRIGRGKVVAKRRKPVTKLQPPPAVAKRDVRKVVKAMLAFRDKHGPILGKRLTVRQLIDEGRR